MKKSKYKLFLIAFFSAASSIAGVIYINDILFYPKIPNTVSGLPNMSNNLIDANNEKHGFVFKVRKPITVKAAAFGFGVITTGTGLEVRLETVSSANGFPSGTLVCTNSSSTYSPAATDDNLLVFSDDFVGGNCDLQPGTYYAVYANRLSTFNGNLVRFSEDSYDFSYTISSNTTAGWAKQSAPSSFVLKLSDDSYYLPDGAVSYSQINTFAFSSGSSPNFRGNRFVFKNGFMTSGAWVYVDSDGDYKVRLYDINRNVIVATATVTANITSAGSVSAEMAIWDDGEYFIKPGVAYGLVIVPGSTTINIYSRSYADSNFANIDALGENSYEMTATNPTTPASWTYTTTRNNYIGFIVNGIDTYPGGSHGVSQ